jgi:hypothetical protein
MMQMMFCLIEYKPVSAAAAAAAMRNQVPYTDLHEDWCSPDILVWKIVKHPQQQQQQTKKQSQKQTNQQQEAQQLEAQQLP